MTIGRRILEARNATGLSREKWAAHVKARLGGIWPSASQIKRWEDGTVLPDREELLILAPYLNTDAEWLESGTTTGKVDGRTLRRKGRTETFSTKTTAGVIQTVQRLASTEGISMVEVFERAIEAYDARRGGP